MWAASILLGGLIVVAALVIPLLREANRQVAAYARAKAHPAEVVGWRVRELGVIEIELFNLEVRFEGQADWVCIASARSELSLRLDVSALGFDHRLEAPKQVTESKAD